MKSVDKDWMETKFEDEKLSLSEVVVESGEPRFRVSKWKRRFGLTECTHGLCSNCGGCDECGDCECEECDECGDVLKDLKSHVENVHSDE